MAHQDHDEHGRPAAAATPIADAGHTDGPPARSREPFASLFHASPIAATISRVDDSRLVDVNQRFLDFFDLRRDEVLGRTTLELGLWADPAERDRMTETMLREGLLRDLELKARTRSGEPRTVLCSMEGVDFGGTPCVISMFVDITPRVAAEARVRALSVALTLAEQRERRRLSQMLHDDLQQILFGLEMRFHLLERALDQGQQAQVLARLDDAQALTRRAIELTRTLSLELDPPVLRSEGLGAALSWLASHMHARYGLQVELSLESGLEAGSADQRALIIQVVRELLFNVLQHANVDRATLRAWRTPEAVMIEVRDEGRGFDVASLPPSGGPLLGLRTVQERLELVDGRLELDSSPGHGTRATLCVPARSV